MDNVGQSTCERSHSMREGVTAVPCTQISMVVLPSVAEFKNKLLVEFELQSVRSQPGK